MKNIQRKLGIVMLALAGLIAGASVSLWIAGTSEQPTRMLTGAGALFILGMIAITRPREEDDGNS
ncbi:hypothetical protein KKG90_03200 [Candidatus Bipolaricaulota bacterium]|nr:hypothetical protein [Candidatus Bipolaricaulota bacterium]